MPPEQWTGYRPNYYLEQEELDTSFVNTDKLSLRIASLPPELWDAYFEEQQELLTAFVNKFSQEEEVALVSDNEVGTSAAGTTENKVSTYAESPEASASPDDATEGPQTKKEKKAQKKKEKLRRKIKGEQQKVRSKQMKRMLGMWKKGSLRDMAWEKEQYDHTIAFLAKHDEEIGSTADVWGKKEKKLKLKQMTKPQRKHLATELFGQRIEQFKDFISEMTTDD